MNLHSVTHLLVGKGKSATIGMVDDGNLLEVEERI
jgi:hypothetical protein